ncbi:MAG: DUF2846 domain-containing protein [Rhodocyclaceae bacterium]|jgi:hypothetical protein|nr:DUF2846 domain-containing protein [Rhodocyclaceae bacterium]
MNWLRAFVISVASILAAGCATGPSFNDMKSKMPDLGKDTGRVFIYRDSSRGAAMQPQIAVNGKTVGTSRANGFFFVDLPAGEHRVSAATEVERSLTLALAGGQTRYVRAYISFGLLVGRINFDLVNAEAGEAAVAGLAYSPD